MYVGVTWGTVRLLGPLHTFSSEEMQVLRDVEIKKELDKLELKLQKLPRPRISKK
jgi:hypothetical protein